MTNKIPTDDELFEENGHPCEYCITKAICKRIDGSARITDCDLPERYHFWNKIKYLEELEKKSTKGDVDSIRKLADLAKKELEENEAGRKAMMKGFKMIQTKN